VGRAAGGARSKLDRRPAFPTPPPHPTNLLAVRAAPAAPEAIAQGEGERLEDDARVSRRAAQRGREGGQAGGPNRGLSLKGRRLGVVGVGGGVPAGAGPGRSSDRRRQ
jgi:hypothetical protein